MKTTKAAVASAAEKLDWKVSFGEQTYGGTGKTEKYVEFEKYSPAGEDFGFYEFYNRLSDLPRLIMERWEDFDPDDHAVAWYGANNGEPSSLQELLDDAKAIEKMLYDLAQALT